MARTLLTLVALTAPVAAQQTLQSAVASVERIWDRAPHSAFTDLVSWRGRLYCAFREGTRHVFGVNGSIRVIRSEDGQNWTSFAHLRKQGVDLRDPKLSVSPRGLMLLCAGSVYEGKTLRGRRCHVAFAADDSQLGDLQPVEIAESIATPVDWLWRVTWHEGRGYGVVYAARGGGENSVHLVRTQNGVRYEPVAELKLTGKPGETTLRFVGNRLFALVRREAGDKRAMLGTSRAPFREWEWKTLPMRLGGPNLIALDGDTLIAVGREYPAKGRGTRTTVYAVAVDGTTEKLLSLPSGGDTSYAGLVLRESELLVSYYSSHEGKGAIYLARLWRNRLTTR